MSGGGSVRFRVLKGSKFLFECEIARDDTLPVTLRQQVVRAHELGSLSNGELAITKRLNLIEVDRMIEFCQQHVRGGVYYRFLIAVQPPQAVITPVASNGPIEQAAFADFASYLKQRERAGVATIAPGVLVLLIPLMGRSNYMQCQIVNTNVTANTVNGATADSRTSVSANAIPPEAPLNQAQMNTGVPAELVKQQTKAATTKPQATDTMATIVATGQQQPPQTNAVALSSSDLPVIQQQQQQQQPLATGSAIDTNVATTAGRTGGIAMDTQPEHEDIVMVEESKPTQANGVEPKHNHEDKYTDVEMQHVQPESNDPFAALRQEHEAFNAYYHTVLLDWSTKPSDVY